MKLYVCWGDAAHSALHAKLCWEFSIPQECVVTFKRVGSEKWEWQRAAMTDGRLGWKYLGSWVKGVSQCKALAESFDCWKWVNYFLAAVQLIGAGTWRPEDIDFWMCVRLSLCVCVCFFVLSCIVSIQIWHFTFAVHFAQIANVTPNSGPL